MLHANTTNRDGATAAYNSRAGQWVIIDKSNVHGLLCMYGLW